MKRKANVFILGAAVILSMFVPKLTNVLAAAPIELKVDKAEYNLIIEDYPSFTSEWDSIYAKMNNKRDTSGYVLALFDDQESTELVVEAFKKQGETISSGQSVGMEVTLYQADKEGDYYPAEGKIDVSLICPMPEVFYEELGKVRLYQLNDSGALSEIAYTLVSVNKVPSVKFKVSELARYAFVLNGTEAPTEVKPTRTPTPTPTPTPLGSEMAAPTTKPSVKASNTPTPRPVSDNSSQTQTSERLKDATPQTGDESPVEQWLTLSLLSGAAIMALLYVYKKH